MYLNVQGIQKVHKGLMCPKGTKMSKVSIRFLKVQCIQIVFNGTRYPKKIAKGPMHPKGT